MRARVKSLGVLVSALLAVCLSGWPEEAKKGPDKTVVTNPEINGADLLFPPGFDRLYDKIYYDTKGTTSKSPQATAAPAQQKNASDLKKEGIELYHSGDYNRAIGAFKQIEGLTQDKSLLAQAYIYLSMSYYCLEEQEESKKWLKKAVATNPAISEADLLFPPGFDKLYYETKGTTSKSPQTKAVSPDKARVADTASGTGGTKKKSSPLNLRLYGGFSRLAAGDVNEGCDLYFELLELYAPLVDGTTSGGYSPVHAGYNFGADFIFQLSPSIGVGIGAGYLQSSKSSLMTLSGTEGEITATGTPKLSAMPIRLAVFLTVPLGGKFNLTADAGAAVYAGLKLDASQRLENNLGAWDTTSLKASRTSLSGNLGFQGSLGFEYKISSKMGFFIEAVGRYARFKNFAQATEISEFSSGSPETDEGKIYLETNTIPDEGSFSWFIVSADPPIDEPPYTAYREPKFDLSGFSLQAGIRIRL